MQRGQCGWLRVLGHATYLFNQFIIRNSSGCRRVMLLDFENEQTA